MKYLNVNLAKHVQILYAENHKANERNFLNSKKKNERYTEHTDWNEEKYSQTVHLTKDWYIDYVNSSQNSKAKQTHKQKAIQLKNRQKTGRDTSQKRIFSWQISS